MKKNLINLSNLLITLLPVLLISGPLLSEIAVIFLIIFFFILSSKQEKIKLISNYAFLIFLLFWLILILTSIINFSSISFFKSLSYLRFGLFFIAVRFFVEQNNKIFKYLFISLGLIMLFLFIDGLYQFINIENLFGISSTDHPRTSSVFGDEQVLGSFTVRFLPLFMACYFFYYKGKLQPKYITIAIFLFSLVIIVISGERMSLLFGLFVLVYFSVFLLKRTKLNLIISMITILIITLVISLNVDLKNRIVNQTLNEMGLTSNKTYQKEFAVEKPIYKNFYLVSPAHQSYFKTAFNMFKDKPFTGHGMKSFRVKCSDKKYRANRVSCATHPHNIYLQLLSETGIVSFFIVLSVFIFFIKNLVLFLFKKKEIEDYKLCLICCILISIWPLATTGSIFNNWLSIIYFFPLGFFKNTLVNRF